MNLFDLTTTVLPYLIGGGGIVFWFLERRKFTAEVETIKENVQASRIENDVNLSKHYRETLDDLDIRYKSRLKSFEESTQELQRMKDKQIEQLEKDLKLKDQKIKLQQKEINALRREIREKDRIIIELRNK